MIISFSTKRLTKEKNYTPSGESKIIYNKIRIFLLAAQPNIYFIILFNMFYCSIIIS